MDFERIVLWMLFMAAILVAVATAIALPYNLHQKDIYRKELILNCNGNLECMQLLLGRDNKYGY